MNGKRLVIGFLIFLGLFAVGLIYAQFFAYYQRVGNITEIRATDRTIPVSDYEGIDSTSSPLKLRGCFRMDTAAVAGLAPAKKPTPLTAPFWFGCFDSGQLTGDLASGAARAYELTRDTPEGFDILLALYPDGRGYLWRQLNERFSE